MWRREAAGATLFLVIGGVFAFALLWLRVLRGCTWPSRMRPAFGWIGEALVEWLGGVQAAATVLAACLAVTAGVLLVPGLRAFSVVRPRRFARSVSMAVLVVMAPLFCLTMVQQPAAVPFVGAARDFGWRGPRWCMALFGAGLAVGLFCLVMYQVVRRAVLLYPWPVGGLLCALLLSLDRMRIGGGNEYGGLSLPVAYPFPGRVVAAAVVVAVTVAAAVLLAHRLRLGPGTDHLPPLVGGVWAWALFAVGSYWLLGAEDFDYYSARADGVTPVVVAGFVVLWGVAILMRRRR